MGSSPHPNHDFLCCKPAIAAGRSRKRQRCVAARAASSRGYEHEFSSFSDLSLDSRFCYPGQHRLYRQPASIGAVCLILSIPNESSVPGKGQLGSSGGERRRTVSVAVRVAALLNREDQCTARFYVSVAHAPRPDAQAHDARQRPLQRLDFAGAGFCKSGQCQQDSHGVLGINAAQLRASLRRPRPRGFHFRPNSLSMCAWGMPSARSMAA